MVKASDVIAEFLIHKGIQTVFGIIGSANSHIYDSFAKAGIHVYNVHNEQCAVIAAGAYYRTCGKMALALVTAGGGATNSVTGIVSLWADSIPTIVITGQESSNYVKNHTFCRMYGTQGLDIVHMVSKVTKYAKTLHDASDLQDELEIAYSVAMRGRKGPVLLDVPFDIQSTHVEMRLWNDVIDIPHPIQPQDIEQVVELLKNSKRPVILGGHGIKLSKSEDAFRSLMNSIQVPVLLTWSAIDLLDHENRLFFGSPGVYGQRSANFIFQKCDVLIVIGSRLTLPQTGYDPNEIARDAKIVMVDIDQCEFKNFAHVKIHADCGEFIRALSSATTYTNREWVKECTRIRLDFPLVEKCHVDGAFPNSYTIIRRISEFLTPEHVVVTDMGTALLSGHQVIHLQGGTRMFSSYGLGEMGYGLPAAFGAAVASGGSGEVLCLNCDGGMMMNIQELQTIVQHKLRVKIVIFNNDGYLMIKHTQKMLFQGNYTAVDTTSGIVLPDYMKVAKAFGYEGFRIKDWLDFDFYFPKFMNYEGPSICEIFMPPEQEFVPKVKGVLQTDGTIFAPPLEEMSPLVSIETIQQVMGDSLSTKSSRIARQPQ